MKQEHAGAVLVVLSAVCYGFLAIFVKFAYTGQINMITTLSGRFVLASLFLWVAVWAGRQPVSPSLKEAASLLVLALLGYGGASTFFFASLLVIPASLASLLLFTHPVMVSLFEVIVYRYPLTVKKTAALALSTTGLILVLGNTGGGAGLKGVLLALAAALSYSAYLLYGNRVVRRHPPVVTTALVITFAAAGFTLYGLAAGNINLAFPATSWVWLLAMALVSTSMGILFLFAGLKRIEAGKASIISTFEVVVTVSLSALLFREALTPLQAAGGMMILAGIIILQLQPGRKADKSETI
ncbi:MAG: DMT family transporter [Peptococcaceae bacterium]|nr:DMT family transporter [Peptococcaceae bacterium]